MADTKKNPDPTPGASRPKAFDLADLDTVTKSNEGVAVELVHPITKEPLGIFWRVLGRHSDAFRDLMKSRVDARIKREQQASKRGKQAEPLTAQQVEDQAIELHLACSLGWFTGHRDEKTGEIVEDKPTFTFRGEELAFSVPNAKRVLTEMLWVREQVDEGIGDLENFIQG